ncbi:DUF1798 family protein [Sporolactobacillus sp. THM7-7]|nr:DUF1798 family protein [Sporolactobacillus sp. THM7-7]
MSEDTEFRLKQLSLQLRKKNRAAHDQFVRRTLKDDYETDFYGEVKPFADGMQEMIDEWRPLATKWVNSRKPRYVYPIQIKDTYDNLSIVCVTAFQKDTRRRRFFETIKAIDYVLDNIVEQLNRDGRSE